MIRHENLSNNNNLSNEILLSICIPTYFRANRIYQSLNRLITLESQNIEFIIVDDGSPDDTKEKVLSISDPRIKFFRNEVNLGQEANVINTFQKANGKFLFLLSDEDFLEFEAIPWILETIKAHKNVVQILGSIWNDNNNKMYYNPGDIILKKGPESLLELLLQHWYFSGLILNKKALNLELAKKYIGCSYIHLYLSAPAMLKGKTICTSKIFCHVGKPEAIHTFDKNIPKSKKKIPFYHPKSRVIQIIFHIRLIFDITKNLPKLRAVLLKKEKKFAAELLVKSLTYGYPFHKSLLLFFEIVPLILQVKILSYSLFFWKKVISLFLYSLIRPK